MRLESYIGDEAKTAPAETYGASTPATLALRQTLAPSDPIKKTGRSTIQALRSAIKYLAINVHHPFFVAPVLTAALFAPEVLGAGLATGLGAAVFAGAFFAEVF